MILPLIFNEHASLSHIGRSTILIHFLWHSSSDNFTKKAFPPNKTRPLLYPHSNAFIDVTQDYMADLFLTTDEGYQLWSNTVRCFSFILHSSQNDLRIYSSVGSTILTTL